MQDYATLRAFVAVARTGSVSRAAEQLHLTQPAISLKLKMVMPCSPPLKKLWPAPRRLSKPLERCTVRYAASSPSAPSLTQNFFA